MEEKKTAKLYNWFLERYIGWDGKEERRAHGNVLGHYRLTDTKFIHTSTVQSVEVNEETEEVIIITCNTQYVCKLSECDFFKGNSEFFISDWDKYKEKYAKEKEYEMEENSILLVFSDHADYYFEAAFVKVDGKLYKGEMRPHIGTFQDSCLIGFSEYWEDYENKRVIDLRYFPHYTHLETYCMESAGMPVYIENVGDCVLYFSIREGIIEFAPGERKRVCAESVTYSKEEKILPMGDLYPAVIINCAGECEEEIKLEDYI